MPFWNYIAFKFSEFDLKMPICASSFGFWKYDSINVKQSHRNLFVETRHMHIIWPMGRLDLAYRIYGFLSKTHDGNRRRIEFYRK